jgi:hypothetical protein
MATNFFTIPPYECSKILAKLNILKCFVEYKVDRGAGQLDVSKSELSSGQSFGEQISFA